MDDNVVLESKNRGCSLFQNLALQSSGHFFEILLQRFLQ